MKRRSLPVLAFGGDKAVVVFYYSLADGKAYSGAGIFGFAMQALEEFEDAQFVFGTEADAIVGKNNVMIALFWIGSFIRDCFCRNGFGRDLDMRRHSGFGEFDRVR